MVNIVCKSCGKIEKHCAKELCLRCYNLQYDRMIRNTTMIYTCVLCGRRVNRSLPSKLRKCCSKDCSIKYHRDRAKIIGKTREWKSLSNKEKDCELEELRKNIMEDDYE